MHRSKLIFRKLWYVPEAFCCSSQLRWWFSCPWVHVDNTRRAQPSRNSRGNFFCCLLDVTQRDWVSLVLNHSRVIYKCSCETVFNKKKLLQEHFEQNTSKLLVGVFKCPQCQLVYMQKQQLMQHVKVRNSRRLLVQAPIFGAHSLHQLREEMGWRSGRFLSNTLVEKWITVVSSIIWKHQWSVLC